MNDERPIEKLLRRYAKKRRDDTDAPVELHPATRQMLQGEVARQFPKRRTRAEREPTTFAEVWKLWRGQLIWAMPVLIVLGIGVWMLVGTGQKSDHEFHLAQNGLAPVAQSELVGDSSRALETPQPVVASSVAPAESYQNKSGIALKREVANEVAAIPQNEPVGKLRTDRDAADGFPAVKTDSLQSQPVAARRALGDEITSFKGEMAKTKSPTTSTSGKSDSLENFEDIRKGYVAANDGRLANAPASPAAVPPDASARFYRAEARGSEREKQQTYSQAFNNRAPTTSYDKMAKSAGITPVLANFQVEQTGNQLRVIDGDGSTYLGEMNPPAMQSAVAGTVEEKDGGKLNFKSAPKSIQRQSTPSTLAGQQSAQNVVCRVSGTNRTLNQQVVFTWNFVELTNELAAAQTKATTGSSKLLQNNLPAQQFSPLLNNSVINGRAQLGDAKEIEINAVPVSP